MKNCMKEDLIFSGPFFAAAKVASMIAMIFFHIIICTLPNCETLLGLYSLKSI